MNAARSSRDAPAIDALFAEERPRAIELAPRASALVLARRVASAASLLLDVQQPPPSTDIAGRARAMQALARRVLEVFAVRVRRSGMLPRAPAILVANHLGWLDGFVVQSCVASVPVTKREVGRWPLVGDAVRAHGAVLVQRSCAHSGAVALRRLRRALEAGVSVLNFPEGTTTRGDDVLSFKRGVFGLALRCGIPVIPVRIDYAERGLCWVGDEPFLPNAIALARRRSNTIDVHFAPAMRATKHERAEAFAARVRERIMELR